MVAEAFVETKEKSLVFADWPAERGAKLILLEGLCPSSEKVRCVEDVVSEKLPQGAVDLISARAGNDVGGRAKTSAEFSVGIVCKDAEFGDSIYGGLENETPIHSVEIICAIDQKVVRFRALTIDCVSL